MRQSHLFTKTRKEAPKDEEARNAELLIRGGFIHKEIAGVYSLLPLGRRVFQKITGIVREEMESLGAQEVNLSALQSKDLWEKTGRWDDEVVDFWFKSKLNAGGEVGLAGTHEEPLSNLLKNHISSYRDLPKYIFQFQTKFRNELRAKSGIMRGREFLMKDLYSFSKDEEEHKEFYERAKQAYVNIFNRVGLGDSTYLTFASGGSFSKYSHEFQTITDAGEDTIYVSEEKGIAINKEVFNEEVLKELSLTKDELKEHKAIEVGNIFSLGTKFSEPLGLSYKDEEGETQDVFMGSYGIGVGRLMGAVVEKHSDESGIKWTMGVAPFRAHILALPDKSGEVEKEAEKLYQEFQEAGIEVLFDDRDASAGEKLSDADLLGMPYRIVVSERNMKEGKFELKRRWEDDPLMVSRKDLLKLVTESD